VEQFSVLPKRTVVGPNVFFSGGTVQYYSVYLLSTENGRTSTSTSTSCSGTLSLLGGSGDKPNFQPKKKIDHRSTSKPNYRNGVCVFEK
jgi:hypothetical protein